MREKGDDDLQDFADELFEITSSLAGTGDDEQDAIKAAADAERVTWLKDRLSEADWDPEEYDARNGHLPNMLYE